MPERHHSHIETCAEPGCEASTETDHWTVKRRQTEGWFFQRNGDIWCPEHVPDWVEDWRARQREKR